MPRALLTCVALFLLIPGFTLGDEIQLFDGDTIVGSVLRYEKATVTVVDDLGQTLKVPLLQIKRIDFADTEPEGGEVDNHQAAAKPRYKLELEERIKIAKASLAERQQPSAIVAMYLETAELGEETPQGYASYRCYSGGGYSGEVRAPLRQSWTRIERVYEGRDGDRRIQIDPGPPYKIINRSVFLKPGEVVNLGRVILQKVEADGTASLVGVVKDGSGQPVADAIVRAGSRSTRTNAEGGYRIDGLGLEQFTITASKPGLAGRSYRVAIRDMSKREIDRSLTLYRPRRVKLRYVISKENSSSFDDDEVQEGTVERTLRGPSDRLSGTLFSSPRFTKFAEDVRLELEQQNGRIVLNNRYAPIYFQAVDPSVDFDAIGGVGNLSSNSQHCPALGEGDMVVIRGFREGRSGVSDYCIKVLVEELTVLSTLP